MLNEDFCKKIPSKLFFFSGSYAIKKQDKDFRDFRDIDIGIHESLEKLLISSVEGEGGNVDYEGDEYFGYILKRITFADESKLDVIIWRDQEFIDIIKNSVTIEGKNYLSISQVAQKKIDSLEGLEKEDDRFIKHIRDITDLLYRKKIKVNICESK